MVAPVKVEFLKSLKSKKGLPACVSKRTNKNPKIKVTANKPKDTGLAQPNLPPCVMNTWIAIMATIKVKIPGTSSLNGSFVSTLLSGVPRISNRPMTENTIANQKIERQPKVSCIKPPNSEQRPEPPYEPIDHSEIARWRAGPSQYALSKAKLAGIIHAADKP